MVLGSLALNGGTIVDATGNSAALTLPAPGAAGSLGAGKNLVIDAVGPAVVNVTSTTPDGFYTVGDTRNPQLDFQRAVIAAVEQVTHIAPPDADGEIIGSPVVAHGVILYPLKELGLCAGLTDARYTTTTEVYPDSPRATPAQCNAAQVAAVCAALDHALAHAGATAS